MRPNRKLHAIAVYLVKTGREPTIELLVRNGEQPDKATAYMLWFSWFKKGGLLSTE